MIYRVVDIGEKSIYHSLKDKLLGALVVLQEEKHSFAEQGGKTLREGTVKFLDEDRFVPIIKKWTPEYYRSEGLYVVWWTLEPAEEEPPPSRFVITGGIPASRFLITGGIPEEALINNELIGKEIEIMPESIQNLIPIKNSNCFSIKPGTSLKGRPVEWGPNHNELRIHIVDLTLRPV
jgi:hypothetical protein